MKCPNCGKSMVDDIEYASGECFDCQAESAKRSDEYDLKMEIEKLHTENIDLKLKVIQLEENLQHQSYTLEGMLQRSEKENEKLKECIKKALAVIAEHPPRLSLKKLEKYDV